MTYQFESPGRLEQRIAANMADESEDLSLGMGRRLSSFASISMETDDYSMSRSGPHLQSFQDTRQEQQSPWTNTSSKPNESFKSSQLEQQSPWTLSSSPNGFQASLTKEQQSPWTRKIVQDDIQKKQQKEDKGNLSAFRQPFSPIDFNKMEGTSTPKASRPDQERMKAYLINSVKTVNPLREAQIRHMTPRRRPIRRTSLGRTPLPGPSRLRMEDNVTEEVENESFLSDVSSTKDLTLPAKFAARANTSFPGIGAGDGGAGVSNARVDPVRLQGYLHKINIQLENENVALKEEKEALKRQFQRALMDCERLQMQIEEGKQDESRGSKKVDQGTMTHNDEMEELRREVERLQTEHDELNDIIDERDAELEAAAQKRRHEVEEDNSKESKRVDQGTMTQNDEVEELKREVERLQKGHDELNDMLDEREAELEAAQKGLEGEKELEERIRELEEELTEEREASNQQRNRFEEAIQQAKDEAIRLQKTAEEQLMQERDDALAQVEAIQLTSARTKESARSKESVDRGLLFEYEERTLQIQSELQKAREVQLGLEKRLEEEARAFDQLEDEFEKVKEDFLQCEEELNGAKDQIMDLQIAAEEKESEMIKLNMQLRQAKEPDEVLLLREKVLLLEAQLEGLESSNVVPQCTPVHKNISLLRKPINTPKSPAELSSASWLNNESSLGDKALLQYLQDLRKRVDEAHAQTDEKLAAGRKELWTDVASLERDLRRVREESERFGSDLEKLRAEQEVTRRETKLDQRQTQQLHRLQETIAIMSHRETNMQGLHHAECKGLLLQIRYEKAKFMRESDLRSDVIKQKEYIVGVLEGLQMVDTTTSRFLADIQTSRWKKQQQQQQKSNRTTNKESTLVVNRFKIVAHAVMAICRAR